MAQVPWVPGQISCAASGHLSAQWLTQFDRRDYIVALETRRVHVCQGKEPGWLSEAFWQLMALSMTCG